MELICKNCVYNSPFSTTSSSSLLSFSPLIVQPRRKFVVARSRGRKLRRIRAQNGNSLVQLDKSQSTSGNSALEQLDIEHGVCVPFCKYTPESENLEGKIIVKVSSSISHQGIRRALNGTVSLQVRGGTAGVTESIYSVIKPIVILNKVIDIPGKLGSGVTEEWTRERIL